MAEIFGSCHCGKVDYAIRGEIVSVVNCHCGLCRGLSGAAFSSYAVAHQLELSLERGQGSLASYAATDKATKYFCRECGTPIFNTNPYSYPAFVMIYLGTLASGLNLTPKVNVFCDSKLPWVNDIGAIKSVPRAVLRRA